MKHTRFKANILSLAIRHSLLVVTVVGTTISSVSVFANTTIQNVQISSGSLAQVVNQFAEQTGILLNYDAKLLEGEQSTGLKGSYNVETGFASLLSQYGLQLQKTATGYTIIAKSQSQQQTRDVGQLKKIDLKSTSNNVAQLPIITITAQTNTTENTGSYTINKMDTATGLALSIKETPQSVSVISNERIKDNGMISVEDALNLTTGITVSATGGERSNYYSRGFQVDNIMVDGVPITHDSDTMGSTSLAMYDRIEVVRGATGLLEGAGNPSASINLVHKRPTENQQISISGSVGSWQDVMGTFDISRPLSQDKSLRGRFVTAIQDADTYTKDYEHKRQLYYAIIEKDISDKTMLTLGGYYNSEKNPGADWNGLPARPDGSFYNFDRSVRSSPAWTYWNKKNTNIFGELSHRFENGWQFSFKSSYLDAKLDMLGASLYRLDSTLDSLQYNIGKYLYNHKQTAFDTSLKGDFIAFGREHEFSLGANYRNNKGDDGPGGWPMSFPYQFDPLNWKSSIELPYPEFNYMWARESEEKNYGIYVANKLNIADPFKIYLGGRLSWNDTKTYFRSGTYEESTAFDKNAKFSPYVALTYDLTSSMTIYSSMTDIFKPQNNRTADGSLLAPVEGRNYEIGLKKEFFEGQFNTTFAVFQINQTNLAQQIEGDCGGLECYIGTGKVRSRGAELELSGKIKDDLNLYAGYTYLDSRYVKDSSTGKAGDRYASNLPQNILTLSTMYSLPDNWEKWKIGMSTRIQSKIKGNVAGAINTKQGSFGIMDMTVAYRMNEKLKLQFNVYNFFDKYYYKNVGYADNANLLGSPRSFLLTLDYKY